MEKKWFPAAPRSQAIFGGLFAMAGLVFLAVAIRAAMGQIPFTINDRRIEEPTFADMWPVMLFTIPFIAIGVFVILTAFAGYEIDDDGITSVDVIRRRRRLFWSEVTALSTSGNYALLESPSGDMKLGRSYRWENLRAELKRRLPNLFEEAHVRLRSARMTTPSNGIYRSPIARFIPFILAISVVSLGILVVVLARTRSGLPPIIIVVFALQYVLLAGILASMARTRVEISTDGVTFVPRLGAPTTIAFSEIAQFKHELIPNSDGQPYSRWILNSRAGRTIRIPPMENMDELVAVIASRMPESAVYEGASPL